VKRERTPLELELIRMIEAEGPLPVDRYMALCLGHPVHGYYMSRDPFGLAGDFTTAPEITQMFGEIIGIWCMQCFELMGRPAAFDLIELGPGRGTLMADLLRASRAMPEFHSRVRVRLIESSPVLRGAQQRTLAAVSAPLTWHETLEDIPAGPALFIANEFFDALPVRQFQRLKEGWSERVIGLRESKLVIGLTPALIDLPAWAASAREGEVAEIRPAANHWGLCIGERLKTVPGAALIVDYGHLRCSPGDTLQAVRNHAPVPILDKPGESDLTAHVDFEALARALRSGGAQTWPVQTQQSFLKIMGLDTRAAILMRNATAHQKSDISAALERLAGPGQMGHLFKVLAATSPGLPRPHPFQVQTR
jgi:NADH dehydrogenase [ubiquinone] 1 alpha subcomplex assembly factor 7